MVRNQLSRMLTAHSPQKNLLADGSVCKIIQTHIDTLTKEILWMEKQIMKFSVKAQFM